MTSSAEPRWLSALAVRAIHQQQIQEHGGLQGLRDPALLESALARPRQRWAYGELAALAELAAAYAEALVVAHAFVDGNKRTGFLVAVVFLRLNGVRFASSQEEVVARIVRLAAGTLPWPELVAWFERSSSTEP